MILKEIPQNSALFRSIRLMAIPGPPDRMKAKLSAKAVLEIANRLDSIEKCFIHPQTGKIEFLPDFESGDFDEEDWIANLPDEEQEDERARIEDLNENWHEIPHMESRKEFRVMEAFMEGMKDPKMKDLLWKALQGGRPFANFKHQLERDAKVRKLWFEFHHQAMIAYIEGELEKLGIDFEAATKPQEAEEGSEDRVEAPLQLNPNLFQTQRLGRNHAEFLQEINQLFQEVFERPDQPTASLSYLQRLLWSENIFAYGLLYDHELIGALTAYILPGIYSESPELFLYDIAIRKPYQRMGLGSRLLKTLRSYGKKNNISIVFVAADDEDTHALDFYNRNGGTPSKVTHFEFSTENPHAEPKP
jgi:aminoglycoside 3-N-acetyltransferase I